MLTSTCSLDQLSILRDLTLEMCVPSLRCIAAHRMQRNTPSCAHRTSVSVHCGVFGDGGIARDGGVRRFGV